MVLRHSPLESPRDSNLISLVYKQGDQKKNPKKKKEEEESSTPMISSTTSIHIDVQYKT